MATPQERLDVLAAALRRCNPAQAAQFIVDEFGVWLHEGDRDLAIYGTTILGEIVCTMQNGRTALFRCHHCGLAGGEHEPKCQLRSEE